MTFHVNIKNCPEFARGYKYIIARNDAGILWFYGVCDNEKDVDRLVDTLGNAAVVIPNDETKKEVPS